MHVRNRFSRWLARDGSPVIAAIAAGAVAIGTVLIGAAATRGPGLSASWLPGQAAMADAPPCGGWDCALQARFEATAAFVDRQPGRLGIVVRDRQTGQSWQAGDASHPIWTASTIKLAIAADLLERARSGEITMTPTMRGGIADMLYVSANRPATTLWSAYGGQAALDRYRSRFGMTGISFPTRERAWGAVTCTAQDLAALMTYVLDQLEGADRDYLVAAMRSVHEVQQWGVWAAGAALRPGVKDGWNVERHPDGDKGWVVNSVGFAGPDERYAIAVMYELESGTHVAGHTLHDGVRAVSDAVATLFGASIPVPVPSDALLLNPPLPD